MKGKVILVELGADPITLQELNDIYSRLWKIFDTGADIAMTYGLTETQDVSVYVFNKRDSTIKYRVFDNKFIEVLDLETKKPVINAVGEIVITPMYWEKGTLLPRYSTGDLGILEFIDDIPFLTIKGRLPDKGTISFTGYKISILGLSQILKEHFDYPIKLQAQILEEVNSSYGILKISLYSPVFSDPEIATKTKSYLEDFITKEYKLDFDFKQGYRRLDISTSIEDVGDKYWSILPKEIIKET